jgi:hypothetical protein
MKAPRFSRLVAGTFATALVATSFAAAQMSVEKVAATNKILQQVKASVSKLDARHQKMLDGTSNIVHLADVWEKYGMRLTDPTFVSRAMAARNAAMPTSLRAAVPTSPGGIVPASNPNSDIAFSSFGGFTQSETSTARCGNTVVVGYNDSGSVFETPYFFTGLGGQSFSGSSYSTNGGASFTDIGPINPGPNTYNFLGGDPMVNCADANTFYFSQIFDYYDSSLNPYVAIALNTSTDGGKSWGDPVAAISKSGYYHSLDKPWSTIDPSNHKRIFVSYTDFDYTFSSAGCGAKVRTAIEFVESNDGGVTWSATPNVAIEVCGNAAVQGSQMAVSSKGTLYISWVNLGSNFPLGPRAIQISSFAKNTLSAPVTVDASVQPGGDSYYLQGEFRDFLDMAMAIDHSGTATDGAVYITWADGRDKIVPDPMAIQGAYAYDDVFLRASYDGGNTWGFSPIKVNSDIQSRLGSGHDHYQSGIAVDNRGYVAVCYYDRRADWENFAIRRHCGESSNGFSFTDIDIGLQSFAPTHGNDLFINPIYMGDYDQLTSDFLNAHSGFIGAFESQQARGNPDAVVHSMN